MSVKFKVARSATRESIEHMLGALAHRGLKADRLFPAQERAALAGIYVIRSPGAKVATVEKTLEPFGGAVEYVEGGVDRRPLGES